MLVRVPIVMILVVVSFAQEPPAKFARAEMLSSDGQPVNARERMPFPSPVLIDLNGDGKRELILGDLWGRIWIHDNVAREGGVAWGPSRKLQLNGKDLKVPNW